MPQAAPIPREQTLAPPVAVEAQRAPTAEPVVELPVAQEVGLASRTTIRAGADGELWFVATDVCRVLEIENVTNAIRILDEDEKGLHTGKTPGGDQAVNCISEPGLYKLMGRNKKREANAPHASGEQKGP